MSWVLSDDGGFIIQSFGKKESFMSWVLRVRQLFILDSICFILSSKLSLACLKKSSLVFSSLASVPLKKGSSRKGCRRVIGTWRSLPLLEPLLVLIFLSLFLSFPVSTVVVVSLALLVSLDLPALERLLRLLCISPGPSKLSTLPWFEISSLFTFADASSVVVFLSLLLLTWSTWIGVFPLSTSSILCSLGIVITITPSWLRLETIPSFLTFCGIPNLRLNWRLTITSPVWLLSSCFPSTQSSPSLISTFSSSGL